MGKLKQRSTGKGKSLRNVSKLSNSYEDYEEEDDYKDSQGGMNIAVKNLS